MKFVAESIDATIPFSITNFISHLNYSEMLKNYPVEHSLLSLQYKIIRCCFKKTRLTLMNEGIWSCFFFDLNESLGEKSSRDVEQYGHHPQFLLTLSWASPKEHFAGEDRKGHK